MLVSRTILDVARFASVRRESPGRDRRAFEAAAANQFSIAKREARADQPDAAIEVASSQPFETCRGDAGRS